MKKLISFFITLFAANNIISQPPRLILPISHTAPVNELAISPNGVYMATASMDHSIKLWDINSGILISEWANPNGEVNSIDFSPDNHQIIFATNDSVKIWDTYNDRLKMKIAVNKGEKLKIQFVKFSPDKKTFLTYSNSQFSMLSSSELKLWDNQTGRLVKDLKNPVSTIIIDNNGVEEKAFMSGGTISEVKFSPDGKKVLIQYSGNKISLYSLPAFSLIKSFSGEFCDFSKDGTKLLTGGYEEVNIWDNRSAITLVKKLPMPERYSGIKKAQFNNAGESVIEILENKSARLVNLKTDETFMLKGDGSTIYSAVFSSNDQQLLTISSENTIKIWDTGTGKLVNAIKSEEKLYTIALFTPDNSKVVSPALSGELYMWDILSGDPLEYAKSFTTIGVELDKFINNGNHFITNSPGEYLGKIWDKNTFSIISDLGIGSYATYLRKSEIIVSRNSIIIYDESKSLAEYSLATGKYIQSIKLDDRTADILAMKFMPVDNSFIVVDEKGWVMRLSVGAYALKEKHKLNLRTVDYAAINDAGTVIIASNDDTVKLFGNGSSKAIDSIIIKGTMLFARGNGEFDQLIIGDRTLEDEPAIWSLKKRKKLFTLKGHTDNILTYSYSPDGKKLLTGSEDLSCKAWDVETGKLLFTLKGHSYHVEKALFTQDNQFIYTSSSDNVIKIWDAKKGNQVADFYVFDDGGYFVLVPGGYYMCSRGAAKFLHYNKNLKVISFEQLDLKYNRPDKVLQAVGNTDTALIRSYRKAWEKRIQKLGIDTLAFRNGYSVPEADFVNRNEITYQQKQESLALHFKGVDSAFKFDRFNIWINEVPVYGQRGISIRNRNAIRFDTTVTIKLGKGENRIEASVSNTNGTESYRMPLIVNYTPAIAQKEKMRFVGIGIDKFTDSEYDLQYSTKDIRDLSRKLKEKYGADILIDTLFNEKVTVANVKALREKLMQTTINDKVILAYSGHGLLSKDYDYYLSTYAVNFEKPEENGLPYDDLESLLDSIPARKKLMLIDACHSGEVDKDELVRINQVIDSLKLKKGLKPVKYRDDVNHLGLKNSFELMQTLFVNVGKSTGATIISAAAGTQFALESGDLENGVFTFCILQAMKEYPTLKISELKIIVGEWVQKLTNGLQKPTARKETIAVDWDAW